MNEGTLERYELIPWRNILPKKEFDFGSCPYGKVFQSEETYLNFQFPAIWKMEILVSTLLAQIGNFANDYNIFFGPIVKKHSTGEF